MEHVLNVNIDLGHLMMSHVEIAVINMMTILKKTRRILIMKAIPIELRDANAFVEELHRHHAPVHRDKFRIGVLDDDGQLCGIGQCARPVSRNLDDGKTIEVVRVCTDGTKNACSFIYSKLARIAKEMGYEKIITYILESESGTSLKASGWKKEADGCGGYSWDTPSRRRDLIDAQISFLGQKEKYSTEPKSRWSKLLIITKENDNAI